MSDNYQEETHPLFKLLRTEAFRFIIVHYRHYSQVQRLQTDVQQRFPDRPAHTLNAQDPSIGYQQVAEAYYALAKGFFFIEHFEDWLKEDTDSQGRENPAMAENNTRRRQITAGLNLRRDKLAKYPIALIVFVAHSPDTLLIKKIMEKMPDLWSFRSLMLDFEPLVTPSDIGLPITADFEATNRSLSISSLGGADKKAELTRLLTLLQETPAEERAFKLTLYPQIVQLQMEFGANQAALQSLQAWEMLANDDAQDEIWLMKGDVYRAIGYLTDALECFQRGLQCVKKDRLKLITSIYYERLGGVYLLLGDLGRALHWYKEFQRLLQKLHANTPEHQEFKHGLAVASQCLGNTYTTLGDFNQALHWYKDYHRLEQELYATALDHLTFKNHLAIACQHLGNTCASMGNLEQALRWYKDYHRLEQELHTAVPNHLGFKHSLSIANQKLGSTHSTFGDMEQALHWLKNYHLLAQELNTASPDNLDFKNSLAIAYQYLGDVHTALGNFEQALRCREEDYRLSQELHATAPDHLGFKNGLAISLITLGEHYEERDNINLAINHYQQAQALLKQLVAHAPLQLEFQKNLDWVSTKLNEINSAHTGLDQEIPSS
jgi:tetratricopeptide (TPR) repeat protein